MLMHVHISRRLLLFIFSLVAASFLGCSGEQCPGKLNCPCDDVQLCDQGLVCQQGSCAQKAATDGGDAGDAGDASAQDQGSRCDEGTLSCRCLSSGRCLGGLRCERGLCQECPEGTAGCPCKGGKTCASGMSCEAGICKGCEGRAGCACYKNNSCDPGHRCLLRSDGQSFCEACEGKGGLLCNCEQDNDCDNGLICVNKRCASPAALSKIPKSPGCYSPCQGNERKTDGTIVVCDARTRLKPGCEPGFVCLSGSCVATSAATSDIPGSKYPFCLKPADCPGWQTCIEGRCYSDCKADKDCATGSVCHSYVCRKKCSLAGSDCDNRETCQNVGSVDDNGLCMPIAERRSSASGRADTKAVFALSSRFLQLSNREPVGYLSISNQSAFETTFEIARYSDSTTAKKPLEWLSFDVCKAYKSENTCETFAANPSKAAPFVLSIKGGEKVIIAVIGAEKAPKADEGYTGVLRVKTAETEQRIEMMYRRSGTGRWKGTLYSFGNFDDTEIGKVRDENVDLKVFKNALLRRWIDFKRNNLSYEQFAAMLQSVRAGTWQQTLNQQNCQKLFSTTASPDVACFPSASPKGYDILSNSQREVPVPSGVSSLDFAIHVKELTGNKWQGRIATSETLHFPGDPQIIIAFDGKPGDLRASYLSSLSAVSDLGGRYGVDVTKGCSDADRFEKQSWPWLIPGFVLGTQAVAGSLFRERAGCRARSVPWQIPSGATDKEKSAIWARNASLSSGNPIPNGRTMRRTMSLIDGALLENKVLFALVKETFTSPFASTPGAPSTLSQSWSRYGYLWLRFVSPEVTDDDTKGNAPKVCTSDSQCEASDSCESGVCQPPQQSQQVSCSPAIVKAAVNAAIAQPSDLSGWSASALTKLVDALLGAAKSDSDKAALEISPTVAGDGTKHYVFDVQGTQHTVHFYCEDTKQFDGGPLHDPRACPASSKVIFFSAPIPEQTLRGDNCQMNPNAPSVCDLRLAQLRTSQGYRENVPYRCSDLSQVYCDTNRADLRDGKIFFKEAQKSDAFVSSLAPLRNVLFEAFRYRIKFQSRSGRGIGFAPQLCSKALGAQVPYCYDPQAIEEIEQRVSCLEAIYTDQTLSSRLTPETKASIRDTLSHAFSYSNRKINGVIFTDPGFETLNAELRVMLGDEAYTKALTSRYDLAASHLLKFEGDRLEPNGVQLSGVLGYEMVFLYTSVHYYQSVLDRFYGQTDLLARSFKTGEAFLSGASVTSYFQKLLLAATRKARSWSQIAKKYHAIGRGDLAKHVLERAYVSAYAEQMLMTRLLHALVGVLDRQQLPQLRLEISRISLMYSAAMLGMQETYQKVSRKLDLFGFPQGYVPFPALSQSAAGTAAIDAFRYVLFFAKEKARIADAKEQIALQTKRQFDTDSARFQSELVKLETSYNEQLIELCGQLKQGDRAVPAIPRYAHLVTTKQVADPCGRIPGSALFNAYAQLERVGLASTQLDHQEQALQARIDGEKDRIKKFCDDQFALSQVTWKYKDETKNLLAAKTTAALLKQQGLRLGMGLMELAQSWKCEMLFGTSISTECLGAHISNPIRLAALTAEVATVTGLSIRLNDAKKELLSLQSDYAQVTVKSACNVCPPDDANCKKEGIARIQSQTYLAQLTLELKSFEYRALNVQHDMRLALSQIQGLQQRVQRLIKEQEDALAMLNDVTAAANDPNQRIYKSDAVTNAERTFEEALKEAYRATLVFEYYTSQSYARKSALYLIRMVSQGDIHLTNYLSQLERAFLDFEEKHGKPDTRVLVLSLRDDILKIPHVAQDGSPLPFQDRVTLLQKALNDPANYDDSGMFRATFQLSVDQNSPYVSPVTYNHKIIYMEAEIKATEHGDNAGYVYVRQSGTGIVRKDKDSLQYYALPPRTAVINPFFNGHKALERSIYRNYRLQDRPLGNTQWALLFNQASEHANQDIKLNSLNDILIYVYYSDFSKP